MMRRDGKCCKNCIYGVVRAKAHETAPNVVCLKKSKPTKLMFLVTQEDDYCKKYMEREKNE